MVFNKLALSCCKNIFYLEEGLYYYNIHPNSLMHSEKAYDVRNDIIAFQVLVENLSQYPDILTAPRIIVCRHPPYVMLQEL